MLEVSLLGEQYVAGSTATNPRTLLALHRVARLPRCARRTRPSHDNVWPAYSGPTRPNRRRGPTCDGSCIISPAARW
jgi:hypothetical protein